MSTSDQDPHDQLSISSMSTSDQDPHDQLSISSRSTSDQDPPSDIETSEFDLLMVKSISNTIEAMIAA